MYYLKAFNRLLGRMVWRLGRIPPSFASLEERKACFDRYGLSSLLVGLLFLGWEIALASSSQLQPALNRIVKGEAPAEQLAGALTISMIVLSRIVLAVFALGILLTAMRLFVSRPEDGD